MPRPRGALPLGCLAAALALCGCSKPASPSTPQLAQPVPTAQPAPTPPLPQPPFSVSGLELGKAVGVDNKITNPAEVFSPKDTVYLSVVSDGVAPAVVLRARWYGPQGTLVQEGSETIASLGAKATPFHLSQPSGLPLGQYTVRLFVDDKPTDTKQFVVAKVPVKKK